MAGFPLQAIDGPGVNGFERNGRTILWRSDDPQPVMTVRIVGGGEVVQRVTNPAFAVPVGGANRRTRMKAAALEFFAPLLEDTSDG